MRGDTVVEEPGAETLAAPGARVAPSRASHRTASLTVRPAATALRALGAVLAVASIASAWGGMYSWHYFVTGGQALLSGTAGGGLHTYASHPELQMGPLTLLVAAPLSQAGFLPSALLGALLMTGVGLLVLLAAARLASQVTGRSVGARAVGWAGAAFLPVWQVLAVHYGHLDDALALGALPLGLLALAHRRPVVAALLLAAATDAKPWAAPVAVVLLVLASPARGRAVTAYVLAVVLPWVPFVLADRRTLDVGRFTIDVADDSVLRLLGVHAAATPPWDRPAQLALGALLAWVAVRRGRLLAVPLVVVAARIVLDPGTYAYYAAGLAVGAMLVDLATRRVPVLTLVTAGWVALDLVVSPWAPALGAVLRLLVPAVLTAAALLGPRARRPAPGRLWAPSREVSRPAAAAG